MNPTTTDMPRGMKYDEFLRESNAIEGVYDDEFGFEDSADLMPGGAAHQAFLDDLKKDKGIYKNPSETEIDNIIQGLQQANLDLPNDQELIRMAEKKLNRRLEPSEIEKIKQTMEKIAGPGSYNESKELDEKKSKFDYETYHPTLSATIDELKRLADIRGYIINDDDIFTAYGTGGIPYETTKSAHLGIIDKTTGKESKKMLQTSIYRMPSGNYELVAYIN